MWQRLQEPTEKLLMIILRVQNYTGKIWNGIKSRLWAVPIVCLPPDFFYGKPDETSQIYDSNTYAKDYTYLGFLEEKTEKGLYRITQRNKFLVGETIEVMRPDGENRLVTVKAIYDEEGNSCDSAPHPQQVLYLDLGEDLNVFDLLRRKESVS